jgi:hypothetical protein
MNIDEQNKSRLVYLQPHRLVGLPPETAASLPAAALLIYMLLLVDSRMLVLCRMLRAGGSKEERGGVVSAIQAEAFASLSPDSIVCGFFCWLFSIDSAGLVAARRSGAVLCQPSKLGPLQRSRASSMQAAGQTWMTLR